jgi:predicted negative regulator of RcsB-dependent stress response
MDEFLSESEQWELVKRWLRENTPWMLAGVALAAAGLGGYQWWQKRVELRLLAASRVYEQLVTAFSSNDLKTVVKLGDDLQRDYPGTGYAEQAMLATARIELENNQHVQAIEKLQQVIKSTSDQELALVARLRIARIQLDQKKPDDALSTLASATPGAFASRYAEIKGDALLAKGDREGALKSYREAQTNGGATVDGELLTLKIGQLTRS